MDANFLASLLQKEIVIHPLRVEVETTDYGNNLCLIVRNMNSGHKNVHTFILHEELPIEYINKASREFVLTILECYKNSEITACLPRV